MTLSMKSTAKTHFLAVNCTLGLHQFREHASDFALAYLNYKTVLFHTVKMHIPLYSDIKREKMKEPMTK